MSYCDRKRLLPAPGRGAPTQLRDLEGQSALSRASRITHARRKQTFGFTLLELCVTLLILSILLRAAYPSLQAVIAQTQATTLANDLVSLLHYARLQALHHQRAVTVCYLVSASESFAIKLVTELKATPSVTPELTLSSTATGTSLTAATVIVSVPVSVSALSETV